jgi:DNA/RNA endonuclease G (NUC1)
MNETFYLNTNIIPQNKENNKKIWYKLENFVNKTKRRFNSVSCFTGCLFIPQFENDKKYVKYQVIGKNNVSFQTHLYKIVMIEDSEVNYLISFLIPNENVDDNDIFNYVCDFKEIEKYSGLKFFDNFDSKQFILLNKEFDCKEF